MRLIFDELLALHGWHGLHLRLLHAESCELLLLLHGRLHEAVEWLVGRRHRLLSESHHWRWHLLRPSAKLLVLLLLCLALAGWFRWRLADAADRAGIDGTLEVPRIAAHHVA